MPYIYDFVWQEVIHNLLQIVPVLIIIIGGLYLMLATDVFDWVQVKLYWLGWLLWVALWGVGNELGTILGDKYYYGI